ncbi:hypothetical protein [Streptomyces pilosus]|uniref:hypothetical protein n=1 Tax=Streptomyces pilosus TaxID=28893 RepID=UPI001678F485|nr:hypothetical protein [Streptomyces pilosus]
MPSRPRTTQTPTGPGAGGLRRLGEWCARHFVVVIVAWLVALVALQAAGRSAGGTYSDNFTLRTRSPSRASRSSSGTIRRRGATAARSSSRTTSGS